MSDRESKSNQARTFERIIFVKNIKVSEKYVFLYLGGKPKTKYGTTDQASDDEGRKLSSISAVMIDPAGEGNPESISVTVPQHPGKLAVGSRFFFQGLKVSYYSLENGRSGLSWKAAGFKENTPLPSQGVKNVA